MSNLKEQILNSQDLAEQDVHVEEWGVTVRVRGFTDEQRGSWQAKSMALNMKQRRGQDADVELVMSHRRAELLVQCLRDPETNARIFADGDAKRLAQKHAGVVGGLFELAEELSGLNKNYKQQVVEAEEDFSEGQS